jgi:hypothetical protein
MSELLSRRTVLGLALGAGVEAQASAEEPANRLYVSRYDIHLPVKGTGFRARLGTVGGRVVEVDLAFPDASDHFLQLVQLSAAGRARLVVEIEKDGRTVRAVGLEAT